MRETMSSSICYVLLSLILCVLLQEHTLAIKQSYVVYLGSHSFGPNPSSIDMESATNSHYDLLGSYVGSTEKAKEAIFYSYNRHINGFAAVLDEDEAANVAKHPNVISMFLNKKHKLQTTRSWDFLGLEREGGFPKTSVWRKTLGEDIIIGNIDTGVWPESKSFSDEGMGPIPKRWRGTCQVDSKNSDKFHCNRKLIGARYFYKGQVGYGRNVSLQSARDFEGHGSHTLSTAGGNFVDGASAFGHGNGTASGGSPKARVAAYKVGSTEAFDADILAGFEAAIGDGVDVLSVSLGEPDSEYFQTATSIGSFHAVANGIIVVCAAGNFGPTPSTVANSEPWMFTVAASTIDRDFTSYITLGNGKILEGASLSKLELQPHKLYPLTSAADVKFDYASTKDALICKKGALDPQKAKGKILVCLEGGDVIEAGKGVQVAHVGAIGMILANDKDFVDIITADPYNLPASHVSIRDGNYILNYINRTKYPVAYISKVKTQLGIKPTPVVASFSSRGPSLVDPAFLKPDITAPGVNIIAAYSEAASPSEEATDKRRTPYITMSGTSVSCPHVAGVVGLLKALHPNWSPAAIKSAIMTTATTIDNIGGPIMVSSGEKATPFEYGAGHIRPNKAMDPGLVYDLNITDHLNYLCGRYNTSLPKLIYNKPYTCPKSFSVVDFNYPTITILDIKIGHSVNASRILTNVGPPSTYKVHVEAPPEIAVSVEPKRLKFKRKGEKREFIITLTLRTLPKNKADYTFGRLDWSDGSHHVRSPIVVKYPN